MGANFKLALGLPLATRKCDNNFWVSFMMLEKPKECIFMTPAYENYEFPNDIASLRNSLVSSAREAGCSHLMMMDTDQVYKDPKTITKLLSHNKDMVCAPVHRRYPPFDPILYRGVFGKYHSVPTDEAYSGDLIEIEAVGVACMLFKLDIFDQIEEPYFKTGYHENGKPFGEDIYLCSRFREAGVKIYCDTSIDVRHLTTFEIEKNFHLLWKKAMGQNIAGAQQQ